MLRVESSGLGFFEQPHRTRAPIFVPDTSEVAKVLSLSNIDCGLELDKFIYDSYGWVLPVWLLYKSFDPN